MTHPTRTALEAAIADAQRGHRPHEWEEVASRLAGRAIDYIKHVEEERAEDNRTQAINVIFDGPPSHESGRFVEVETDDGKGIHAGEWLKRDDGLWALRIDALPPAGKSGPETSIYLVRVTVIDGGELTSAAMELTDEERAALEVMAKEVLQEDGGYFAVDLTEGLRIIFRGERIESIAIQKINVKEKTA